MTPKVTSSQALRWASCLPETTDTGSWDPQSPQLLQGRWDARAAQLLECSTQLAQGPGQGWPPRSGPTLTSRLLLAACPCRLALLLATSVHPPALGPGDPWWQPWDTAWLPPTPQRGKVPERGQGAAYPAPSTPCRWPVRSDERSRQERPVSAQLGTVTASPSTSTEAEAHRQEQTGLPRRRHKKGTFTQTCIHLAI